MKREELNKELKEEAKSISGKVSWLYVGLNDSEEYLSCHAGRRISAAGMIEVPVMLGILDCAMQGSLALEDHLDVPRRQICRDTEVFEYGSANVTVYELLYWMMAGNDNTSANILIKQLRKKRLNTYFRDLGLKKTQLNQKMTDYNTEKSRRENETSLKDVYRIFKGLYEESLLDEHYRRIAQLVLKECRDSSMLKRYLCDGWSCAHKTGLMPGTVQDAGIFDEEKYPYFLGISASCRGGDKKFQTEASKMIGRMSRIVAEYVKSREN